MMPRLTRERWEKLAAGKPTLERPDIVRALEAFMNLHSGAHAADYRKAERKALEQGKAALARWKEWVGRAGLEFVLAEAEALVALDPPLLHPLGQRLSVLADWLEEMEAESSGE